MSFPDGLEVLTPGPVSCGRLGSRPGAVPRFGVVAVRP